MQWIIFKITTWTIRINVSCVELYKTMKVLFSGTSDNEYSCINGFCCITFSCTHRVLGIYMFIHGIYTLYLCIQAYPGWGESVHVSLVCVQLVAGLFSPSLCKYGQAVCFAASGIVRIFKIRKSVLFRYFDTWFMWNIGGISDRRWHNS